MNHATRTSREERVLVLAPTPADATLSRTILVEAGFLCEVCVDLASLCRDLEQGAGAIVLTEEVLAASDSNCLVEAIEKQPDWSDLPILLLADSGADSPLSVWAMDLLGNLTILERPVRVTTLVSALRTALKARRRQYELRSHMETLRTQNERLRLLWEATAVLFSADDPDTMLRGLFNKIGEHLRLDVYFNFVVDDSGDALRLASCAGIPEEQVRALGRLEFGQAICGTVAAQHEPIVATYIQQSQEPMVQLVKSLGIRAYACNPLLFGDRLLGTLSFASRRRDEFKEDELEFLETISRYVTVAYERLRLINRLREADRRKDEFLATLAHELRNPLAPIRTGFQILRMAQGDRALAEQARAVMERQMQQLVRLIDDLLDVSRITRNKLELRKERVELERVVQHAVETSKPLIESAGHELTVRLPPEPMFLNADVIRLAQVLSNLLNNAAKYTEPGGKIWLTAERQGSDAVVSVRDTGVGIPSEMLPKVFEMFTQVDRSLERSQGGLGLGLSIVKHLAEMHGGSVEARSDGYGKGSEFQLRLPLALLRLAPPPGDACGDSEQTGRLCKVLVVDDNRGAAEMLEMMLRIMGHDTRTAHDGVQAVEAAATFLPDIVLLDIGLPKLNGYEVARRIREQPWGKSMTLIALTGWGQEDDKRKSMEAGFDHHLVKPVDPTFLEKLLARACPAPS